MRSIAGGVGLTMWPSDSDRLIDPVKREREVRSLIR
jgi:hypothetical protein